MDLIEKFEKQFNHYNHMDQTGYLKNLNEIMPISTDFDCNLDEENNLTIDPTFNKWP